MEIVKRRTIDTLLTKLNSPYEQTRIESICELRLLTKNDTEIRPLIAESNAVPLIAELLYSPTKILHENAIATLLNLSISCKEHLISSDSVLDAIANALRRSGSPLSAQCAAAVVCGLLSFESNRSILGQKREITSGFLEIVRKHGSGGKLIKDSLRALFGIAICPLNRALMVELGAVHALFSLVVKEGRVGLIEDATAVIAQVAGCEASWEAFMRDSRVGVLMDLMDISTGSSRRTKENAVYAVINLVNFGGEKVVNELKGKMEERVIDGIVDVLKNGSEKGRSKASMLLKIFAA